MRIRAAGILLFFLLFSPLLSLTILAGDYQKIFSITDPVGDDYGPGTYNYPTDEVFKAGEGLFDIVSFSISESEEDYLLDFEFTKLTDPWRSKFGFSLPFIEVYIDNQEGGATDLFRNGANVRLDPRNPWDLLITLSGWWVRAYKPDSRDEELDFWNTDENPWDVKNAVVKVEDNRILLYLNKEVTGPLQGASLYLLIGGFDPFGPGYYRNISNRHSRWSFADLEHANLDYAPRVIDIILPGGKEQERVLADFEQDYPVVYPVRIVSAEALFPYQRFLFPLTLLIILLIFVMYKLSPVSHNNK